jgi:hypothetical protein
MEIMDGFVVDDFDYCDRWCEACAFTARCRVTGVDLEALEHRRRPEHAQIEARAKAYSSRTFVWLKPQEDPEKVRGDPHNPLDVIGCFAFFIAAKVHRGFSKAMWNQDGGYPSDHDGSARVAIEAIDRSRAAWLAMVQMGMAARDEVAPFIMDLAWLREALERQFPKARDQLELPSPPRDAPASHRPSRQRPQSLQHRRVLSHGRRGRH